MQPFGSIRELVNVGADAIMLYFRGESLDEANDACQTWLKAIDAKRAVSCPISSEVATATNNQGRGTNALAIKSTDNWSWLVECVVSYDSMLLVFNIEAIDSHGVYIALSQLANDIHYEQVESDKEKDESALKLGSQCKVIPVWYGAPNANDLREVSEKTSLSIDDIIALHTSVEYKVYAVGFAPGFAYMGDVPEALQCARLNTPRKRVPKGAVALADRQTAVYPSESPGGWNLLGVTPLEMVVHGSDAGESLLKAGDRVKFKAISEEEFKRFHEN